MGVTGVKLLDSLVLLTVFSFTWRMLANPACTCAIKPPPILPEASTRKPRFLYFSQKVKNPRFCAGSIFASLLSPGLGSVGLISGNNSTLASCKTGYLSAPSADAIAILPSGVLPYNNGIILVLPVKSLSATSLI